MARIRVSLGQGLMDKNVQPTTTSRALFLTSYHKQNVNDFDPKKAPSFF
jgi:hypothetical protein